MEVKTYSCILRPAKNPLHEVPLACVTKQELQLLAFIHGVDAVPVDRIRPLGKRQMVMNVTTIDGVKKPHYVESDMDEYRRLVLKYDTRVNPGKGKQYVEACFKVTIDGFDHLLAEVDALTAMEKAIDQAELDDASKVIQAGATARSEVEERAKEEAARPQVGSRIFANAGAPA